MPTSIDGDTHMSHIARAFATTCALSIVLDLGAPPASAQAPPAATLRDIEAPAERLKVAFSLTRSLGSLHGAHDAFGNIWDVELDGRGRIYVADVGQAHITVFDSAGRYLHTIGRRGSGPGEFNQPMQMGVRPGDTLLVFDVGLRRLSEFAPDGRFLRQQVLGKVSVVNDIEFLPNGDIVLVGFTPLAEAVIHILDRELRPVRSFGEPAPLDVQYFSESLLGGYADVTPAGLIVYTQKSPFEIRLYKPDGTVLWRCTGLDGETTPPSAVVRIDGDRRQLQWNRFIHSAGVFALSEQLFLNVITDPTRDRRRLDVIDRDCRIRATSIMDVPFLFVSSKKLGGERFFTGVRSLGSVPEAVVYRFTSK